MRGRLFVVLAGALVVPALLAACGGGKKADTTTTTATTTKAATPTGKKNGCVTVAAPPSLKARKETKPALRLPDNKVYEVTMLTNCGSFTIRMDQAQSPNAVTSFVSLVRRDYFDHTIFHRIVPGFVIQGGDPTATGTGGPGYSTVDTPPKNASYTHGVVAMAKTATEPAGTAGSQFFIVTVANAGLPPDYAIIGKVVKGLPVVDHIGTLGDASQQPTQVVEIERATVRAFPR
jgi:peptidyl-prolyl cis-trans isomerase B (cyclophilin B)